MYFNINKVFKKRLMYYSKWCFQLQNKSYNDKYLFVTKRSLKLERERTCSVTSKKWCVKENEEIQFILNKNSIISDSFKSSLLLLSVEEIIVTKLLSFFFSVEK